MATTTTKRARPRSREPYKVGTLSYACRKPCDDESGFVEGYFTGEVDTWGKHTFVPLCGDGPLYFFPDEITQWEPGVVT